MSIIYKEIRLETGITILLILGVMPPSILAIQAGKTLNNLTSTSTLSLNSVLVLGGLAVGSLVPVLFRQRLKKKFE